MNPIGRRQPGNSRPSPKLLTGIAVALSLFVAQTIVFTQGAARERWVGTWATAVVARNPPAQGGGQGGGGGQAGQQAGGQQAQAGRGQGQGQGQAPAAQAPANPPVNFNNQTIRQIVHTSVGGSKVRIVLSNAFGTQPLEIDGAHVALRKAESMTVPGTDRTVTFSGSWPATIPAGGVIYSDPINLAVPAMSDLAIDLHVAGNTATWPSPLTIHGAALTTNYISPTGNFLGNPNMPVATKTQNWFFLSRVDVMAPAAVNTLVALGDSITDGTRSTPDTNNRWPDQLIKRVLTTPSNPKTSVLNLGIAGNRVLRDGAGVNVLARLDRDVLVQPNVKWVVFLEGINDVGLARQDPQPTPAELIAGHKQVIERLHARGIKVYGGTLLPFEGVTIANYYSDQGEATRQAVNQWIRTGKAYDGVIDFDMVMRDPASPKKMLAAYDGGDKLHPNDVGYKAMADAVYQAIFKGAGAPRVTDLIAPPGSPASTR